MGFSFRTFKRLFPEAGKSDGGSPQLDFGKAIPSLSSLLGVGVASAVDVVGEIASFGEHPERYSLHSGGGLIEWSKISPLEAEILRKQANSDGPDLPPVAMQKLREQAQSALKVAAAAAPERLPDLGGRDGEAESLARLLFPELAHALEAMVQRDPLTVGVLIDGKLGADLVLGGGFGVCVSRGSDKASWGFFKLANNPVKSKAIPIDAGATVDLSLIIVFGGPDRFAQAAFIGLGDGKDNRLCGLRTQLMLAANERRLLGVRLLDRIHVHIPPRALRFDALLQDAKNLGSEWSIALEQAALPSLDAKAMTSVLLRSFSLFKPWFYGRLRCLAGAHKDQWLIYAADRWVSQREVPVGSRSDFRIVAGLAGGSTLSIESISEQGTEPLYLCANEKGVSLCRYDAATSAACSFELVRGLADGSLVSFQRGTRCLCLSDSGLAWVEIATIKDKALATFELHGLRPPEEQGAILPDPPHRMKIGSMRRSPSGRFFVIKEGDGSLAVYTGSGPLDVRLPPRPNDSAGSFRGSEEDIKPRGEPGSVFTVLTDEGYLATFRGTAQRPGELVYSSKHGAMHWAESRKRVRIQTAAGTYLMAEDGGNSFVRWDSAVAKAWETFELVTLWNGQVALRSHSGLYVSARFAPGTLEHVNLRAVSVDRPAISDWDAFTLVKLDGERLALRTQAGRLLRCDPTGRLTADGLDGDPLTAFTLKEVETDLLKQPGALVQLVVKSTGELLTIPHSRVDQRAELEQWPDIAGLHQTFVLQPAEAGTYRLCVQHTGKVLEVIDSGKQDGARLVQRSQSASDAQRFLFEPLPDGTYRVTEKHSGKALDYSGWGKDRGAIVQPSAWHGGDSQHIRVQAASVSARRPQPKGQWQNLGGSGASDVSGLALADGRLAVFFVAGDGQVHTRKQIERGGDFAPLKSLGHKAKQIAVAQNVDGRVAVAFLAPDGGCFVCSEKTRDGDFGPAIPIDTNDAELTFGTQKDGRLVLLVRGASSQRLFSLTQQKPGGDFGKPVDHSGSLGSGMAAGRDDAGRLYVFLRGGDGAVWVASASQPNGPLDRWESLGGGTQETPTVTLDGNGALQMFTRGVDGGCYTRAQSGPNQGWSNYVHLGGAVFDVAAVTTASGDVQIYHRGGNQLYFRQSTQGGFTDWKLIPCDIRSRFSPVVLPEGVALFTQNADGSVGYYF